MPLFQKSVLNKYLKVQDQQSIDLAYTKFKEHFLKSNMQEEIRGMKEEEYQDGFLDDLFVNVLGYIKKPKEGYNLVREKKNESDGKKADGAILKNDSPIAVIELKGTDTKDLDKVNNQAFQYKNNHSDCIYVVTSNFEKLRFFIHNAVEHIEFNLFTLTKEEFSILWLCLQSDNLIGNTPLKANEESIVAEENITKTLYKDYSSFKHELWQNVCKNDPEKDQLLLFKKSQKLLDRFLFIFFAEDSGLLPPNSISRMVERYAILIEQDAHKPLYEIFKQYFGYINIGREGKTRQDDIFAYNGGLFLPDDVLDNFIVDDELLKKHVLKLTAYDFQSDVDVNILGHIFENSLNDIENVTAMLEGQEIDKSKTKRKKDGVFYTPKYITKYIVDNTVGKLCEEKKAELGIIDEEYVKGRRNRKKDIIKQLDAVLQEYREWLLNITICDPACGSGAFLNQALEFLIEEHTYIDELESQLMGMAMTFPGVENHILEKNIYGVDINDESVEIAKLSLWLRTAQRGRKLTSLNNNIKCGNSLIDDSDVAGAKAFNWQIEFAEVFDKGGFDVVIGNPPYVKRQNLSDENQIRFMESHYQSATYNFDLYLLFIELGSKIINKHGLVSYINPSKFTSTKTGEGLRNYIDSNCHLLKYIDFKDYQVFEDATTYCCIFILNNDAKGKTEYLEINEAVPQVIDSFEKNHIEIKNSASGIGWQFKETVAINGNVKVKDIASIFTGIETGADNIFVIPSSSPHISTFNDISNLIIHPLLKGSNANRYYFDDFEYYALVPYKEDKSLYTVDEIQNVSKEIWKYLETYKEELSARDKGRMNNEKWYGYVYPKNLHKYNSERLIWSDISIRPQFSLDKNKNWHVRTLCSLELNEKGISNGYELDILLGIFNSKLFHYYIVNNSNVVRGGYLRYRPQYLKEFTLPNLTSENDISILKNLVRTIVEKSNLRATSISTILDHLSNKFNLSQVSKKLQNWDSLEFTEFINELEKGRKATAKEGEKEYTKLSLSEEAEWMQYFNEQKVKTEELKNQINQIDKQIDQMVFELYGLTDEEIQIVENG